MDAEQLASSILDLRGRTVCTEQFNELIDVVTRYARIRVDWARMDLEERHALDSARTAAHEVLIDACNILSRGMAKAGEDNQWRAALGTDRQIIGDVACYMHCLMGLAAR